MNDRDRRARELLESSGFVQFYKERQLVKKNRIPDAIEIMKKRLGRIRLFVVISAVVVAAMFVATLIFDPNPSGLDYATIIGLGILVGITEYNNRRIGRILEQVEAMYAPTGSDETQALS